MNYIEETIAFKVNGEERKALMRTPKKLFRFPALMMNFGLGAEETLECEYLRIVSDIFLAAGHRVASLDMFGHGEFTEYGESLEGQTAAINDGVDIFADMRRRTSAFIDVMIKRGLARKKAIVLDGTSRGGLMALHVFSEDERVLAASIHSPRTYIPRLTEFKDMADNPIIQRSNAEVLIPKLADKPLFIAIGELDERIGSECCFDFYAKLRAQCKNNQPVLFTGPGKSHDLSAGSYMWETGYFAAAGFLLQQCAGEIKMFNNEPSE